MTHIVQDQLSKTSLLLGRQCEKALYLSRYFPELAERTEPADERIFTAGRRIGMLARGMFPGGSDASDSGSAAHTLAEQIRLTQSLIEAGVTVIYEAAFSYDGLYCAVDILVKDGDDWKIFEVKSSSRLSAYHIFDTAIQVFVLQGCGLSIVDASVIRINRGYTRTGSVDLNSLFAVDSVIEKARRLTKEIKDDCARLRNVLRLESVPNTGIGSHCGYPYSCSFIPHCWKDIPDDSVFRLSGLSSREQFALHEESFTRLADVPLERLPPRMVPIVECFRSGAPVFDVKSIRSFLQAAVYPLHFLDFEALNPGVPLFEGGHPYDQIPFQYSMHIVTQPAGRADWKSFLAKPGTDPRREFALRLIADASTTGSLIVYNASFEKRILRDLMKSFPDLAADLEGISARMQDLVIVFKNKWYLHPRLFGKFGLKSVLPLISAGELSYDNLPISDGSLAAAAYEDLCWETEREGSEKILTELETYCRMDTEALLIIWRELSRITNDSAHRADFNNA